MAKEKCSKIPGTRTYIFLQQFYPQVSIEKYFYFFEKEKLMLSYAEEIDF